MYKLEYELDLKELSIEELKNLQEDIKKELDRRTVKVVDKTE
jgi:ribosomal protein L29|tara:strand:- start:477 stop:602 length:126 start_codon:yes stop_codon:yes gene_type:complete